MQPSCNASRPGLFAVKPVATDRAEVAPARVGPLQAAQRRFVEQGGTTS
jgi:hypothetical protein